MVTRAGELTSADRDAAIERYKSSIPRGLSLAKAVRYTLAFKDRGLINPAFAGGTGEDENVERHQDHTNRAAALVRSRSDDFVTGFAFAARIYKTDATRVEFKGESSNWSVWGTIDRITSTVKATTTVLYPISVHSWDLICKPRPFSLLAV
jgi:hypothetical protein